MIETSYYPILLILLQCIFTFILSPLSVYAWACQFLRLKSDQDKQRFFLLSLGTGPLLIVWLLVMLMYFVPGLSAWGYIVAINIIFILPLVFLYRYMMDFMSYLRRFFAGLFGDIRENKLYLLLYSCALIVIAGMFFASIFLPFTANDPIEYAVTAKIFYQHMSVGMYPIVNGEAFGGFIAPYTHPLAYAGSLLWMYLIQGTADHFGLARIISPFFALITFITIVGLLRPKNKTIAIVAGLFYLATPTLLHGFIQHQIEAVRLYGFFAFFMVVPYLIMRPQWRSGIVTGIFLGICLFTHSLGLLAIPIFLVIYFLHAQDVSLWTKLRNCAILISVGLIFVLLRYSINFSVFGGLIQDSTSVREIPSLFYNQINEINQGIATTKQKWLNGFLPLFTGYIWYGLCYAILPFGLLLVNKSFLKTLWRNKGLKFDNHEDVTVAVSVLVALGYVSMIIFSIIIGRTDFIINFRYMLTAQPLAAIAASWILVVLCRRYFTKNWRKIIACFTLLSLFFATPLVGADVKSVNLTPHTLLDDDFAKAAYGMPLYQLLREYNHVATANDKLLSFTNGQTAYFANTPFVYRTDERLVPLYTARTKSDVLNFLHDLGVTYILVPSYGQIYITQSKLQDLLADPAYSELVAASKGGQLYRLHFKPLAYMTKLVPLVNSNFEMFNGRHEPLGWTAEDLGNISQDISGGLFLSHPSDFLRQSSTLHSISTKPTVGCSPLSNAVIASGKRYHLSASINGLGMLNFGNQFYHKSGYSQSIQSIPSFTLRNDSKMKPLLFQFATDPSPYHYDFSLSFMGPGKILLKNIKLEEITYVDESHNYFNDPQKQALIDRGWGLYQRNLIHAALVPVVSTLKNNNANTIYQWFSHWSAVSKNDHNFITIFPEDSQKYFITTPPIALSYPEVNIHKVLILRGEGIVRVRWYGRLANEHSKPISATSIVALSNEDIHIDFSLSAEQQQNLENEYPTLREIYVQLEYIRPSHNKPGEFMVASAK